MYNRNRVVDCFYIFKAQIDEEDTYIFRSGFDAIFGFIVLLLIPIVSFLLAFNDKVTFLNYYFPIVSILFAEAYDAYGRLGTNKTKNKKLYFRLVLVGLSLLTVFITTLINSVYWLPSTILIVSAMFLLTEMFLRLRCYFIVTKLPSKISARIEKIRIKKEKESDSNVKEK